MTVEHVNTAILGAGIAGLGAAHRAKELCMQAIIFESRPSVGGLLDNFTVNGYRFDYAVHLSFAKKDVVREVFDKTPYHTHLSDSFCFEDDRWLKHPVQNNLFPLPTKQKVELIKSFLTRPTELTGEDYESWLRRQYGDAISDRYPIRYTSKYWDTPARELSTSWIGNRMRDSELEEILSGALSPETPNHYYAKEMRYPKAGGYKSFIQPLIDSSEIRCNHRCTKIDTSNKRIIFENGNQVIYENLVSTIPLPELALICPEMPENIRTCTKNLKATSIDLISIGFNKNLIKDLWFYIYDEDILASRAYSPSVKSPENVPQNCSSLQFEIYTRGTESQFNVEELKINTLSALEKMNIARPEDIVLTDHRRIRYGNVIYDLGMEVHRDKILDWCKAEGIASCGRFGEWGYLWSDQSFMSGYNSLQKQEKFS